MIFVMIHGIPTDTSQETLQTIRQDIVDSISTLMKAPGFPAQPHLIQPFFVPDMLVRPVGEAAEAQTIYVQIDTDNYSNSFGVGALANPSEPYKLSASIAEIISNAFMGKHNVKVLLNQINSQYAKWIKAIE